MGFLTLEKEYDIKHIVAVYDEKKYGGKVICIGSPYIHDIIVISMTGKIIKRDDGRSNNEIKRYMQEFDADPEKLREIVTKEDDLSEFTTPVYICENARIRKELCKEIGWPNVTAQGKLMYENTSFKTFREAYHYACHAVRFDKYKRKYYREDLLDRMQNVCNCIKYRWRERFDWIYVNSILRIKSWLKEQSK